jgi:membrane fusion protein, multidrug efflux system
MMHDDPVRSAHPPRLADAAPPVHSSLWTRVVWITLGVATVAVAVWLVRVRAKNTAAQAEAASRAARDRVVPVLTVDATRRDVSIWREGLGNVSAFYTVTVKTQVDGRIDKVLFKEGERVKKGDVLVQIDPRPFQIQLLSAQATLERDQAQQKNGVLNLERYKTLSDQKLIPEQQYTDQSASVGQLDAQLKADQASVASAQLNLDYARITSPIDGVTGVRLVDPGNVVHAADTTGLVVVTQLDPIAVFFTLPEDDLPAISSAMGTGETLSVEALARDGEAPLGRGKLAVIDNQISQATATIRLKAIFDNPKNQLWPNQFVKARIHLATRRNGLVIPTAAVQRGPQGTFVYVVAPDSTAMMRPIEIDLTQADATLVGKGLNDGDQVVVEGQAQLRPAAKVSAKPQGSPASSSSASAASAPSGSAGGGHGRAPGTAP